MKKARLLHNPTAGDNDFSKKELLTLITSEGFECTYGSVNEEGWDEFKNDTDFLIIAGGDGTVRSIVKVLMKRQRLDKQFPLALLPHGTANNIAGTLGISGKVKDIVKSWHHNKIKSFDIGKVYGIKDNQFFLEGFGCGIFPRLMKVMEKMVDDETASAETKLKTARSVLYDIVLTYEAQQCKIVADEIEHSGKYLMVEVMNIKSIGPNLEFAKSADPGDGELEIILIPEGHQKKLETYLLNRINGEEDDFVFTTIKAKKIQIIWEGKDVHLDDEKVNLTKPLDVTIEITPGMLEFMVVE